MKGACDSYGHAMMSIVVYQYLTNVFNLEDTKEGQENETWRVSDSIVCFKDQKAQ